MDPPALLVAAGVGVAALLALVLQEFTTPYALTGGARPAATPVIELFFETFQRGNLGTGATVSVLLLAVLMLLGAGVTLLILRSGLRLELDGSYRSADRPDGWPVSRAVGVAVAVAVLLVVLVVALFGIGPLLGHVFGDFGGPSRMSRGQIVVNTWLPPLVSTLVGVVAAALAAFGIGALRPLGRRSEWLLWPFGLFLFVGIEPLAVRAFNAARTSGQLNSFVGLIPPTWLAIPALFVLTLLFRGQAMRLPLGRQVVTALPMVALAFLVTWVVQAQSLFWPLLATNSAEHDNGSVALARQVVEGRYNGTRASFDVALSPVVLVLLFLVGVAAQLFYLDRIALRVGAPESDPVPPPAT